MKKILSCTAQLSSVSLTSLQNKPEHQLAFYCNVVNLLYAHAIITFLQWEGQEEGWRLFGGTHISLGYSDTGRRCPDHAAGLDRVKHLLPRASNSHDQCKCLLNHLNWLAVHPKGGVRERDTIMVAVVQAHLLFPLMKPTSVAGTALTLRNARPIEDLGRRDYALAHRLFL